MDFAKCVRCGKYYNRLRLTVCPSCEAEEEKEILEVSSYLKDHPNNSLEEVSDTLNIYLEDIMRWMEEKRLEVQLRAQTSLKCEACGNPITSGRICTECKKKLLDNPLEELHLHHGQSSKPSATESFRDRVGGGGSIRKYRRA